MSLHVRCTYINLDRDAMIGKEPDFTRAFTDDRGKLFRDCQREYGRCVSKMYRDRKDAPPIEVGWVFQGKDTFSDCDKTYIREVWVEVRDIEETHED